MNPDETALTLREGFTIEKGSAPQLWASIVGLPVVRPGRPQQYWIAYGNSGNTDAADGMLLFSAAAGIDYSIGDDSSVSAGVSPRARPLLFSHLLAGETRFVPFKIHDISVEAAELKVAAVAGITQALNAEDSFETVASFKRAHSQPTLSFLTTSFVARSGKRGGPGYVHYFLVTVPGKKKPELQIGVELRDGRIAWSFPDIGVTVSDFIDKGALFHRGSIYEIVHLWGVRPFQTQSEMDTLMYRIALDTADSELRRVLERNLPYCNPGQPDCPSCVGFVSQLLFPNRPPVELSVPCPQEFCPPGAPQLPPGATTESLFKWILQNSGYSIEEILREIANLGFPNDVGEFIISRIMSFDPNDKIGPLGVGTSRFISGSQFVPYSIFFENLESATAPAQEVVVTDQLDLQRMDVSTFSLGPISFGKTLVGVPPGRSNFAATVDLRPAMQLLVRINAGLNPNTGLVTWRFRSTDPATGDFPSDPRVGFLPPNTNPPQGDGSVLYTVQPKLGLSTGTEIRNKAVILFDTNPPIETPEWRNTVDSERPRSRVDLLPATFASERFTVNWSGNDIGSGIRDFTIFVSENGGPFLPWLVDTSSQSGRFTGQRGKTYAFYSTARDFTGNTEDAPSLADTQTRVLIAQPVQGDVNGDGTIDCADLTIVKSSFGKRSGQAGFDLRADVVKDGLVNVRDLAFVSRKLPLGTRCP